jgi:serine/threonine protein kinase
MMWWDDERVEATVDRAYVLSHLRPDEARRLDQPLEFGDGLTDDTYMEWIEQKAKRIFLILVDIGVPDQIFGVVDDSWDDDDLPIPLEQVDRLQLTPKRDERIERRFFQRQFTYLLRHVRPGENIYFEDAEIIPLELVDKRPAVGLTPNNLDKVCIPGRPRDVFYRRKIPLGDGPGQVSEADFLSGIEHMRTRYHRHLVSIWGSYIYQSVGYVLLTPVHDGTLKSCLAVLPPSIKILAKADRRVLIMNWIHCLTEAISFLHSQGHHHGHIKPANILIDSDNNIFFTDSGTFATQQTKAFDKETYDYSAPELCGRPMTAPPTAYPARVPGARRPTLTSPTTSPTLPFSTLASGSHHTPSHMPVSPSVSPPPLIDPLKADVYSLGCIYLELLTLLLKRSSKSFASHRSAKNVTAGRGGGLPDASFHKNPGQVESWVFSLLKDAKKKEDRLFRGISHLLNLVTRMLSPNPHERPSAKYCKERVYEILTKISGFERTHCGSAEQWPLKENVFELDAAGLVRRQSKINPNDNDGRVSNRDSTGSGSGSGSGGDSGRRSSANPTPRRQLSKARPWKAPVYAG